MLTGPLKTALANIPLKDWCARDIEIYFVQREADTIPRLLTN